MSDEPDQVAFEQSLRGMSPAAVRLDPIAAAFAAGQGSMRRRLRLWQSTAAAAAILLLGAGSWSIHVQRNVPIAPSTVLAVAPLTSPPSATLSEQSLIMLQQSVREKGIEGLPAAY